MKKLLFLSAAVIAVSLTSCNKDSSGSGTQYAIRLSTIEYKEEGKPAIKWELGYGNFGSTTIVEDYFTTNPMLIRQKISGAIESEDVTQIDYSYTKNAIKIIQYSGAGEKVDSLKIDGNGMASLLYVDQVAQPYDIAFGSDGYRTKVGETVLLTEGNNYVSAITDGVEIRFNYTPFVNSMGIQQYGIPGSELFWPTYGFGKPSNYLLDNFTRKEDGKDVKYSFHYQFDSNRLLVDEVITRDGQPFMKNKYTYMLGIITLKN